MRITIKGKVVEKTPYTWAGNNKIHNEIELIVDTADTNAARVLHSIVAKRNLDMLEKYDIGDEISCEVFMGNPKEWVSRQHGGMTVFNKLTLMLVHENVHQRSAN